jgi:hypothetical protein
MRVATIDVLQAMDKTRLSLLARSLAELTKRDHAFEHRRLSSEAKNPSGRYPRGSIAF